MQMQQKSTGTLACLIWLLLASQILSAQTAPPISLDDAGTTNVATQFLQFTDTQGQDDIQDILEKDRQQQFAPPQSGRMNTGYSTATYWMKLRIENSTPQTDWYLVPVSPYMQLAAWRLSDDTLEVMHEAPQDDQSGVVPLVLATGTQAVFYIRLRTPYIADLHLKLMNRKHLNQRNYQQLVFVSLVAGCFFAMIVYNFFLFLTIKDRNFLFYLLFALVNSHLNLLVVNFPPSIDHWLGWNWWSIMPFYVPMAPMVTFIFARSFLKTSLQSPALDKTLLAYMGGLAILILAAFVMPAADQLNILNYYMLPGVFLLLFAGLRSLMNGFQPAKYFLAAIGTFLLGILILLMREVGFLPANFFTNNAHLFAQAAEMLLMSLALGSRIKLLEEAKTRAEVAAEVKSRLLRIISHDIATPLTVVKATAYHLKKDVSDSSRVERVVRAASIIEEIIGFIRKKELMENGESMELGPVALQDIFDELAFLFHDRALDKDIVLNFDLKHPDLMVLAEPVSLSNEVLANLISNAIKFSYPGSQVHIRAAQTKDGRVAITIQDQGIGMDAATLASLFDPSVKQSRPGTQGERGIGFGMPLAKAYVDAYGGLIEVQSSCQDPHQKNSGTTLRITLDATVRMT
jgi:signal transduction histidine kinase